MNPITHGLAGWTLANLPQLGPRDRLLVTLAAVLPDLDGFGLVAELATEKTAHPLFWWSTYHHVLGHNLVFGLLLAALAFLLAQRRGAVAVLSLLSFHLHLLGDLIGARGPDGYPWPIPYLYPVSDSPRLAWSGQWELNAWPNVVLSLVLLLVAFRLAWSRGYSPLGILSSRADAAFVAALRRRFGSPADRSRPMV